MKQRKKGLQDINVTKNDGVNELSDDVLEGASGGYVIFSGDVRQQFANSGDRSNRLGTGNGNMWCAIDDFSGEVLGTFGSRKEAQECAKSQGMSYGRIKGDVLAKLQDGDYFK